MDNSVWAKLPFEVLGYIFSYLPRRDRLACSMVCVRWEEAMHQVNLWRCATIYLDKDFMEPSTLFLTPVYRKYLNSLELGFSSSSKPHNWMNIPFDQICKKMCRLLIVFYHYQVKIKRLKLFDWHSGIKLKKVFYHLARLLELQTDIQEIEFSNANFGKEEMIKIMRACRNSSPTITSLLVHNIQSFSRANFETVHFYSCLDHFYNLTHIKMEYSIFARGVIESILTSQNHRLQNVDLIIRERDVLGPIISFEEWGSLKMCCPKIGVGLTFKNLNHHEDLIIFLKENIPLKIFFLAPCKVWDKRKSRNFTATLNFLLKSYSKSLVNIDINTYNNTESLDDVILKIFQNCPLLEKFNFTGILEHFEIDREMCLLSDVQSDSRTLTINPKCTRLEDRTYLLQLSGGIKRKKLRIGF